MSDTTGDAATVQQTTYKVINYLDATKLKKALRFSPTDLDSAQMDQAALFADYGVLAAQASHQVDVVKLLLENSEAAVYKLLREAAAERGEKVTEAQLEKLVARHPRVISMKKALAEAKQVEAVGKVAIEAFKQKRDMLIQQGVVQREERKGELYTLGRSVAEDARKSQIQGILDRRNDAAGAAAE